MDKFRVGVVGAGTIAHNMHLPVLRSMNDVDVVWLTDANRALGNQIAQAHGVPFVEPRPGDLPDCDVVLLAIPVKPRRAYIESSAARGIAVLVEKPFAVSYAEQSELQGLFAPYAVGCAFQRRTYASIRFMREAVLQGWFGRLNNLSIHEGGRTKSTGQDDSYQNLPPADGGGMLLNLGCHGLDSALYITDAVSVSLNSKSVVWDGVTDRRAEASFLLHGKGAAEDGCQFDFCVSTLDEQSNEVVLTFDQVELSAGTSASSPLILKRNGSNDFGATIVTSDRQGARTAAQAFYLEWRNFLDGVRAKTPSLMSAQSASQTAQLLDTLLERQDLVGASL